MRLIVRDRASSPNKPQKGLYVAELPRMHLGISICL